MNKDGITEFLKETLALAGEELLKHFGSNLSLNYKKDKSLVTNADIAADKLISERIKTHFPEDKIFSEEQDRQSSEYKPGTYCWIVDPLDGTTNFANSYPFFCTSIARTLVGEDGKFKSVLGGVYNPIAKKMYTAELGKGAYCNDQAITVSDNKEFKKAFLCTGFYYNQGDALRGDVESFARVANVCQPIRRDGAAALDLALVAEGIFDGFWEKGLQPWDIAAGILIITEAKGKVCNYKDPTTGIPPQQFDMEGTGIIAGSPTIVDSLLKLI